MIQHFTSSTIDSFIPPNSQSGRMAKHYLIPIIKQGCEKYIKNSTSRIELLVIDDVVLPISIGAKREDSYIFSPYTQYITYALEETKVIPNYFARTLIKASLGSLALLMRAVKPEQVIMVNNWLLSTNLYPPISSGVFHQAAQYLRKTYPNNALLFRSLNDIQHATLCDELRKRNFQLIANRKIYIDPKPGQGKMPRDLKRDKAYYVSAIDSYKLVKKVDSSMAQQLSNLYSKLYLEKYSYCNPQYTAEFFKLMSRVPDVKIQSIRESEQIIGMILLWGYHGVMTAPCVGYDTETSKQQAIYRKLMYFFYKQSYTHKYAWHASSGVGMFKRNRGCQPAIEYLALYAAHLPRNRRFAWSSIKGIVNNIGIRVLSNKDY